MGFHDEPVTLRNGEDRPFQTKIFERNYLGTFSADEMMVMAFDIDLFVGRRIRAQVNPLDQAQVFELIESPVNGRPPNVLQLQVDFKRSDPAVLPSKQINDLFSGGTPVVPGLCQLAERVFSPGRSVSSCSAG